MDDYQEYLSGIFVCPEHKKTISASDTLQDAVWRIIRQGYIEEKKKEPDVHDARLAFYRLSKG